ncbi:MAG: hypothetical protein K9G72_21130 [Rhodobacteraceae bacterium]|nr:hypothetical protein [Paracoccaceae bacterium]
MTLAACMDGLRAMLPPEAGVGGADTAEAYPIMPGEALAGAHPARQRETAAGRHAARMALGRPVAVGREADHAPIWPEGWIGSITHSGPVALAAVLPQGPWLAIGIDIEDRTPLVPAVARLVAGGCDSGVAKTIFVAKEAAYKAQFMISRQRMGFDGFDVRITPAGFEAQFTQTKGPFAAGTSLRGRLWFGTTYLVATVVV